MGNSVVNVATWASAWTPASVLFAGHPSNGQGQCALDGGSVRLHLPAGKLRAVIGQNQFEITHEDFIGAFRGAAFI